MNKNQVATCSSAGGASTGLNISLVEHLKHYSKNYPLKFKVPVACFKSSTTKHDFYKKQGMFETRL